MHSDSELLRHYVETQSESAFTALVQRHIGLVYSVALRRVGGDAHLAEDVAQMVFTTLARKGASLCDRPTLAGWLHTSTHLAAAAVVRRECRRKTRETTALTMQNTFSAPDSDPDWTQLRPVLDDVIVALKESERDAIALRFFEQCSFAEIGTTLRLTEEAARKRVERALEKLRVALGRRGVTSTAAALGIALTAISASQAPAALTTKVAGHALTHATASTAGSFLGTASAALAPAIMVLALGGFLIAKQRQANARLHAELDQLMAQAEAVTTVRAENLQLARAIREADDLRRTAAQPAVAVPAAAPVPRTVSARLSLSTQGVISWDREPVSLGDFVARLKNLQVAADPESRINIRAVGADIGPLLYVIDEVRKAGFEHVTVESDATLDPKTGGGWF